MAIQNNTVYTGISPVVGFFNVAAQLYLEKKDPTAANYNTLPYRNFQIGTFWLNTVNQNLWYLAAIQTSPKVQGKWVQLSAGAPSIETLSGNTGTNPVSPLLNNINVFGDGVGINISGDGANKLTASLVGGGVAAQSFITNPATATAVPTTSGVLTFAGAGGITAAATGNTVTFTGGGVISESFHTDGGGIATPSAGVINIITGNSTLNSGSSVSFSAPGSSNTVQLNVTDANSNTIMGNAAGIAGITGTQNTVFGGAAGTGLTSGTNNLFLGYGAGTAITSTNYNCMINHAGVAGKTQFFVFADGSGVKILHNYPGVDASTTNGGNIFLGGNAGNFTLAGGAGSASNNGIGTGTLGALTSGARNDINGAFGCALLTTGSNNTGTGHSIGYNPGGASGLTTGSYNVLLGYTAGTHYTSSESSNILINNLGTVSEANALHIGAGTGTGNQQLSTAYISGIYGVTTTSGTTSTVLISNGDQLGTISSSRRFKENIEDMADQSSAVLNLRPVTFNYKKHTDDIKQFGLIAEEVYEVMPEIVNLNEEGKPDSVRYHDLPALLLNEVIKLRKELDALKKNF